MTGDHLFFLWMLGYWVTFCVWLKVDGHPDYWTEDGFLNTIFSPIFWPFTLPLALYRCYKIVHTPLGDKQTKTRHRVDVEYEEALKEVEDFLKETK
jgi:hypothetical protein